MPGIYLLTALLIVKMRVVAFLIVKKDRKSFYLFNCVMFKHFILIVHYRCRFFLWLPAVIKWALKESREKGENTVEQKILLKRITITSVFRKRELQSNYSKNKRSHPHLQSEHFLQRDRWCQGSERGISS